MSGQFSATDCMVFPKPLLGTIASTFVCIAPPLFVYSTIVTHERVRFNIKRNLGVERLWMSFAQKKTVCFKMKLQCYC